MSANRSQGIQASIPLYIHFILCSSVSNNFCHMFIMQSLIRLLFYPYAKYILKLHIFAALCSVHTVYPEILCISTCLICISPLYSIRGVLVNLDKSSSIMLVALLSSCLSVTVSNSPSCHLDFIFSRFACNFASLQCVPHILYPISVCSFSISSNSIYTKRGEERSRAGGVNCSKM